MRKEISQAMISAAGNIAMAPGKFIVKVLPDNGPGGPGYAFAMSVLGGLITLPITLPLAMVAKLIEPKGNHNDRQ